MNKNSLFHFVIALLAMLVISCSNSSELRFMGKSLSVSCEEFEKHLETKGFKHDSGQTYKGKYLGEEVSILLEKENNGHYTQLTLMLVSDPKTCTKYYRKVCQEIEKEHSGFKQKEKEKDEELSYTQQSTGENINIPINNQKTEFYNKEGKEISISCYNAAILATVMAIFEMDD